MEQITSAQLSEWEAYDRLDPIGEWRGDYHMAFLSSLITNIATRIHGKKGAKMTELMDFMPVWSKEDASIEKEEPRKQSVEEQKQILQMLAAAFKKDTKKRKNEKPKKK